MKKSKIKTIFVKRKTLAAKESSTCFFNIVRKFFKLPHIYQLDWVFGVAILLLNVSHNCYNNKRKKREKGRVIVYKFMLKKVEEKQFSASKHVFKKIDLNFIKL
jgi:hypothetical protein